LPTIGFDKGSTRISERLNIHLSCGKPIEVIPGFRQGRHKINARVVLFDEAEVVAFIESARVG
jgi:hypothetical protein